MSPDIQVCRKGSGIGASVGVNIPVHNKVISVGVLCGGRKLNNLPGSRFKIKDLCRNHRLMVGIRILGYAPVCPGSPIIHKGREPAVCAIAAHAKTCIGIALSGVILRNTMAILPKAAAPGSIAIVF